jgi:HAE1 family hydrophobic/amphiphilic exporter-1
LTSSMLLTLVVVPVIYVIIDKIKNRFTRKKAEELPTTTPLLQIAN